MLVTDRVAADRHIATAQAGAFGGGGAFRCVSKGHD